MSNNKIVNLTANKNNADLEKFLSLNGWKTLIFIIFSNFIINLSFN